MVNLLVEFISEECTNSTSRMLVSEIEKLRNNNECQFGELTFNRFNVYVDLNKNEVRLEDDLNLDEESGTLNLNLDHFLEAIKNNLTKI